MPSIRRFVLLASVLLLALPAGGQDAGGDVGIRTWTSRDGKHTTQAVYAGFASGKVRLRKEDGATVEVALVDLSDEDGDYVRRIAEDDPAAVDALVQRNAELEKDDEGRVIQARFPPRWRVGRQDVALLAGLPNLARLGLAQTRLAEGVIEDLKHLQGLRQLDLTATLIGNPEVRQLTDLRRLDVLNLSDTQITNRALSYMRELPKLSELARANTNVGDQGIAYLEEVQTLKKLNLGNIRATPQGILRLRKALPNAAMEGSGIVRRR